MKSKHFWTSLICAAAFAQQPGVLGVGEPAKLTVKRGEDPVYALKLSIQPGYHANSNTPSEKYLIPFKLTWEAGPLETVEVTYPKAKMEKYDFSETPLSVFDGSFEVTTKFRRTALAKPGPGYLAGKLRYQACNKTMCLPPKTVDVKVPLLIQ